MRFLFANHNPHTHKLSNVIPKKWLIPWTETAFRFSIQWMTMVGGHDQGSFICIHIRSAGASNNRPHQLLLLLQFSSGLKIMAIDCINNECINGWMTGVFHSNCLTGYLNPPQQKERTHTHTLKCGFFCWL